MNKQICQLCRLTACCLLLACTCVAAAATDATSPRERAKWRLATHAAARRISDDLQKPTVDNNTLILLQHRLTQTITNDIPRHASLRKSRKLCRKTAEDFYRASADRKLQSAIVSVAGQSSIPVTASEVKKNAGSDWNNLLDQSATRFISKYFDEVYKAARQTAVDAAKREIERNAHQPAPRAINRIITKYMAKAAPGSKLSLHTTKAIRKYLAKHTILNNRTVLDEVKYFAASTANRLTAQIASQYNLQAESLTKASTNIPPNSITTKQIAGYLQQALQAANTQYQSRHKNRQTYDLFDTITASIPTLAQKIEDDRFAAFINQTALIKISQDELAHKITANRHQHRQRTQSKKILLTEIDKTLKIKLAETYSRQANQPEDSATFLAKLQTGRIAKIHSQRLNQVFDQAFNSARQHIAEEDFKTYFPELLTDADSPLKLTALKEIRRTHGAPIKSASEAVNLLKLGGYASLPDPTQLHLLEETEKELIKFTNRKIKAAQTAQTAQLSLLRNLEKKLSTKLKTDTAAGRQLNAIRTEWTAALSQAWNPQAAKLKTSYTELTPITLDELEKAIHRYYDSIKKEPAHTPEEVSQPTDESGAVNRNQSDEIRQDPAKSEEIEKQKPGEDQSPKNSPQDLGDKSLAAKILSKAQAQHKNQPDAILLLTSDSNQTAATLLAVASGTHTSADFSAADAEKAAETVFQNIQPQLTTLLNSKADAWRKGEKKFLVFKSSKKPKLKLFVVIESNDIRHRMSLFLRDKIETAINEWTASQKNMPAVELDWKVGLSYEPADNK